MNRWPVSIVSCTFSLSLSVLLNKSNSGTHKKRISKTNSEYPFTLSLSLSTFANYSVFTNNASTFSAHHLNTDNNWSYRFELNL